MAHTLKRTEQFMNILGGTTKQNTIRITELEFSESRDGSAGWKPFDVSRYWGRNDSWYRFRTEFAVPEEYTGRQVKAQVSTGQMGVWNPLNPQFLVYLNGKVLQALDANHISFTITEDAREGERYTIEFEAYAGLEYAAFRFNDHPLRFLVDVYCHDVDSENLYYDLKAAKMAAEIYPETDYVRIQIENYLTNALNMLDFRIPSSPEFYESVRTAHAYMDTEFYGKFCGHEEMIANCIGHTHIDVAWKWRLEQTRAKAVRSFATEIELLKEYPEHRFTSSQPQLYQYVKEDCPELYEEIKKYVKEGRWEVEGAMWLESDCNLTSGESLIRQILHGKRFMKEEFGVDSKVLWLPDVFGYSAALPQILKKTGVENFVTSKIHWSDTNHFPYDTFIWKGIDGSEIFTQYITASTPWAKLGDQNKYSSYNAQILPISMAKGWEIYQQKDINNEILVSFGFGDGGGGVNREMLEMSRRLTRGIPGIPKTRITNAKDTLTRIKNNVKGKKVPKWFGELYLEFHRGTYTSMAKNKRYNRKSEFLLQSTEAVSLADKLLTGGAYDKQELYDSWTTVLLNQFHDIIPGSSIKSVYEDSEAQYEALIRENSVRFHKALEHLAARTSQKGIFVYNPTGTTQSGMAECNGEKYYVENVPAWGWKVVPEVTVKSEWTGEEKLCQKQSADAVKKKVAPVACATHMENEFFSLELDEKGTFTSIYDKRAERQVLTKGQRGNVLQVFDDHPFSYDNWELSRYYDEKQWEIDEVRDIRVVEQNDLSASIKITKQFLNSVIEQTITIYRDIPRIDFDTKADWHERHVFVKAAFPVDVLSDKASYEIQYGAVERPAHRNTSWDEAKFEVCAHKWADFSEAGYGVALLNDCKYGHDIHDGVMRLSLIKCGTYPNPEADQGEHHFKYALLPHMGDWREAGVAKEAYAFNCPLIAVRTEGKGTLAAEYSLAGAEQDNIFITVVKEACDSEDMILRAYEAHGSRTRAKLHFGIDIAEAYEVDMLEQTEYERLVAAENEGCFTVEFKPYEIKTFRLIPRKKD